jgi:hypothetical protein
MRGLGEGDEHETRNMEHETWNGREGRGAPNVAELLRGGWFGEVKEEV